jgi:competence ComEA-like helix-hairpin-helix protein
MTTPININNTSLDELKGITGISDRRAQKIIKIREEKGSPLTLEYLKLMSEIPNTMWDPLIQKGEVTIEQEGHEYGAEKVQNDSQCQLDKKGSRYAGLRLRTRYINLKNYKKQLRENTDKKYRGC